MVRLLSVAAVAAAALSFTPATAAEQGRGYYSATLASAPDKTSFVTRSTVWKCSENVCTAAKSGSRDSIMCELVAKRAGALSAFAANGTEFDADALAKCNESAR